MKKLATWAAALSLRSKILMGAIALLVLGAGAYLIWGRASVLHKDVPVTMGSVVEQVSVTGNTSPVGEASLSFENSGTIVSVQKPAGATISRGDVIATLDASNLGTQLRQAEANVAAAQAKLAELQAGAQPEDLAVSIAALAKSRQDLQNQYQSSQSTLTDSYAKANDAVRSKLNMYFSNPESRNPQINFISGNSVALQNAQNKRVQVGDELATWKSELAVANTTSDPATIETALGKSATHLALIQAFLSDMYDAAVSGISFPSSSETTETAKANIVVSVNETNLALQNIRTSLQNIASQKALISEAEAQLALKQAGTRKEDIAAQQAQVASAEAQAESIRVQMGKSVLRSPLRGVVSIQNAKVGQIATPGTPIVTIISKNDLEVDASLPEVDIGKVHNGNAVDITFDAFPGEHFAGSIFYIDPAETTTNGVVNYKVKIAFDTADPRIKSGLTTNLAITTQRKDGVLILPQFAILETDAGSFVKVAGEKKGTTKQVPITTGIRDEAGNVEIRSGVTLGQMVLNLGIKTGGK